MTWLGIVDMFQTFEDLESIKDKRADVKAICKLLDGESRKDQNTQLDNRKTNIP